MLPKVPASTARACVGRGRGLCEVWERKLRAHDRWGCIEFIRKEATAYIRHRVESSLVSENDFYQLIS